MRKSRTRFTAAPASVRQAREWAREVLNGWAQDGVRADALLVLSELMANAMRHGRGPVEVSLSCRRGALLVEVADNGAGRVRRVQDQAPDATGGRGLLIVEALSVGWGVRYRTSGKVVWAELAA